jgi:Replication-relaxation
MTGNERLGLVIQERDRHLLEELAVMRVVDREQARIVAGFGSTTRVNTRLLALCRAGLLRRFFLGATAGGRKALYALSTRGAAFIGVPIRGPRRRNDEVLIADFYISHQLAVNSIFCALKYGVPTLGISFGRWISFSEPLTKGLGLIPDGYFELVTSLGITAAFLEVDLGHEGLAVWKEKTRKYLQLAISGDHERLFGQKQFRVLVIANSERRLLSIRKTVRISTQKIFWFTTIESIRSEGLFSPVWLRPEGDAPQPLLIQTQSPT